MKILTLTIIAFTFFQCTIEKRLHQKGYHVAWNTNRHTASNPNNETTAAAKEIDTTAPRTLLVAAEITKPQTSAQKDEPQKALETHALEPTKQSLSFQNISKCGTIELNTGRTVKYSSYKIEENTLFYKKCDDNFSDWQNIDIEDITSIKDSEGKMISLERDETPGKTNVEIQSQPKKIEKLGIIAFLIGFVVIATILMLLFLNLPSYLSLVLVVVGMIIPMLLMFILSIASLRKMGKNPKDFRLKGITILLASLALITSFIGLLSFAVLALFVI
jgi:hypothetical protein